MAKKAEDPNQKQSFPREVLDQSPAARLAYFKSYTIAHSFLERANKEIWDALQEPGGALMIFIVGPTGVGKTTLWEHIDQRLTEAAQARMLQDPDHMPFNQVTEGAWQAGLLFRSLMSFQALPLHALVRPL